MMKTFQAIFNEKETKGVFGISLVHDPAMEGVFVALKKEQIQLKEIDSKKFILAGLVLEPNKPIYRNQNGEEFNLVFDDTTVEQLCYHFTKQKHNSNSTIEHEEKQKVEGVTFVENWLVRDEKIDTAVALGLNCKKGSWVTVMKCDNKEIYEKALAGEIRGFSIDAMLSLKEVNLKSDISMSEMKETLNDFKNDLLIALNLKKVEVKDEKVIEVKMGSAKSQDGAITFEFEGDAPAVGGAIWVVAEDGTKVPVPVGEYVMEDTSVLKVEEDGVIASFQMPEVEAAPAEMEAAPNTGVQDASSVVSQVQESIKSIMIKYAEAQDAKFELLRKEIVELKEQPASKKINSTPVQVDLSKMTKNERILNKIRNN
jgi:hypothetical protein